jgi:hypothetical protein
VTPAELDALERRIAGRPQFPITADEARWLIAQARKLERAEWVVEAAQFERSLVAIDDDALTRNRTRLLCALAAYDAERGT